MRDGDLKKLVAQSYKGRELDEKLVEKISSKLNRKDLKKYIALLKAEEKKKEVYVTSAQKLDAKDIEEIQKTFPSKKLVLTIDKAMIGGIKIVENDMEYEINLNRTFHDIMRFLSTND